MSRRRFKVAAWFRSGWNSWANPGMRHTELMSFRTSSRPAAVFGFGIMRLSVATTRSASREASLHSLHAPNSMPLGRCLPSKMLRGG